MRRYSQGATLQSLFLVVRKLLNESYYIGIHNANEEEEPIDRDE